jgi:hypothetical protein
LRHEQRTDSSINKSGLSVRRCLLEPRSPQPNPCGNLTHGATMRTGNTSLREKRLATLHITQNARDHERIPPRQHPKQAAPLRRATACNAPQSERHQRTSRSHRTHTATTNASTTRTGSVVSSNGASEAVAQYRSGGVRISALTLCVITRECTIKAETKRKAHSPFESGRWKLRGAWPLGPQRSLASRNTTRPCDPDHQ